MNPGAAPEPFEHGGTELPCHEVYAIRYGHHERTVSHNFIHPPRDADLAMPMDYFLWLIKCPDGSNVVVDTGFSEDVGRHRGREMLRSPTAGLQAMGVDAATVEDVVITHLHYDHVGNTKAFKAAKFWLQESEMQFATGRYMCRDFFRLAYEKEEIVDMVRNLFDGRIAFVSGNVDMRRGISLHHVGGHTAGLQVVRVHTASGWVVLASDLFHYYDNFELESPYPIVFQPDTMLDAFSVVKKLASSPQLLVPGHDPLVMQRFVPEPRDPDQTVRVWQPRVA